MMPNGFVRCAVRLGKRAINLYCLENAFLFRWPAPAKVAIKAINIGLINGQPIGNMVVERFSNTECILPKLFYRISRFTTAFVAEPQRYRPVIERNKRFHPPLANRLDFFCIVRNLFLIKNALTRLNL